MKILTNHLRTKYNTLYTKNIIQYISYNTLTLYMNTDPIHYVAQHNLGHYELTPPSRVGQAPLTPHN